MELGVRTYVYECMGYMWRSETILRKLVLSFYSVDFRDLIQVIIRLDSKVLLLSSHLSGP